MAANHPDYDGQYGYLSSPPQITEDYGAGTSPSLWSSLSDEYSESFLFAPPFYTFSSPLTSIDHRQPDLQSRSDPSPILLAPNAVPPNNARSLTSQQSRQRRFVVPDIPALLSDYDMPSPVQSPFSPHVDDSSIVDLTQVSSADPIPASRKRKAGESSPNSEQPHHDGLVLKKSRPSSQRQISDLEENEIEELDLINIDDDKQYAEYQSRHQTDLIKQQQEQPKKAVRLATFQCIICLDNPTDLTVTHCGHMFCSICLHEALHAGTQKRACPVCRTTIGSIKAEGKQPKNGFYALEMKLMTSKRKGKQPQRLR